MHWNAQERAVLHAVEELTKDKHVSDVVWEEMSQFFTQTQRMDIVATVGNYTLVSMMLNAFGVQLDDWLEKYSGFPAR